MKNHKHKPRAEVAMKREVDDILEEERELLHKRPKKQSISMGGFAEPSSQFNPLVEPSPLGLRLRKTPSLLDLIQMKLSQSSTLKNGCHRHGKEHPKSGDKLKASNFSASVLKIGTWEYKSKYDGDLVAKCYYAKHKLVWEVLDGGLKNKIEFQWSDIVSLKANYPDDGPGTLQVVLARQPLFFRENDPQPRKHTLWHATSDFTNGQASIVKLHYLECPPGLLEKHFEKLIQCDPRLHFLSQQSLQGEIAMDSPYFESKISRYDDQDEYNDEPDLCSEGSPSFFRLKEVASPSGAQSSCLKNDDCYPHETLSPCSGLTTLTVQDIQKGGIEELKSLRNWEQIRVPGLQPSTSMSDLVRYFEHRISEQGTPDNPSFSKEEWEGLHILEDITRCLFNDTQNMPDSDEKSLMSRVNSLCCLLQKEPADGPNTQLKSAECLDMPLGRQTSVNQYNFTPSVSDCCILDDESDGGHSQSGYISRKDSVGDLLLNLPRIASLPQFLFNIPDDFENNKTR